MPQLDLISFFNQVFWLFLFFVLFYTFFIKNLVPFILRILKLRKLKVEKAYKNTNTLVSIEAPKAKKITETIFLKAVNEISIIFLTFSNKVDSWVNYEVGAIQLKITNINYKFVNNLQIIYIQKFLINSLVLRFISTSKGSVKKIGKQKLFFEEMAEWFKAFDCKSNFNRKQRFESFSSHLLFVLVLLLFLKITKCFFLCLKK